MKGLLSIVGMNRRNLAFVHAKNPRKFFPWVDDKVRTKRLLTKHHIQVPESLGTVSRFSQIERTLEGLAPHDSFVIKPAHGRGGGGILVVSGRTSEGWHTPGGRKVTFENIKQHLAEVLFGVYSGGHADQDVAMVEAYLQLHPMLANIYNQGVADIRVLMIDGRATMAMLRIPTDASDGKANLHQGGLGVPVDLETGRLGVALSGTSRVELHPNTGAQIAGTYLPHWKEVIEMSHACARTVPLQYLGIDIVLDEDRGPVVLEMNARPGLQIQAVNQRGLRDALERIQEGASI